MSHTDLLGKKLLVAMVVLVVTLALPLALHAQDTDPVAVVTAMYDALNAGDIDAFLDLYAEDAIIEIVPFGAHTGHGEIRVWAEGLMELNAEMELEVLQVDGNVVTAKSWYSDDDWRAMGIVLEAVEQLTVQDGKITVDTWVTTDETLAEVQAAMAALPETGLVATPTYAPLMVLGSLGILAGIGLALLRRRSRQG
jgi:ketosteroid isomerase-like protein